MSVTPGTKIVARKRIAARFGYIWNHDYLDPDDPEIFATSVDYVKWRELKGYKVGNGKMCPKWGCRETSLQHLGDEIKGNEIHRTFKCPECGATWEDVYRHVYSDNLVYGYEGEGND